MNGLEVPPLCVKEDKSTDVDIEIEATYTSQSRLLQDFFKISSIDKLWIFNSDSGTVSHAMFSVCQPDLLRNRKRKFILPSYILKEDQYSVKFQWPPFPIEMGDLLTMVPSPSGHKLLKVRNCGNESSTLIEIWNSYQLEKEFYIPASVHGQVYTDGWFEGISWSSDETYVAYVAEEPAPSKPMFTPEGYKKGDSGDKDGGCWKGQGDWQEDWGETYAGKQQPALFIIDLDSGEVCPVKGIEKYVSVGQVVWAPVSVHHYLVFVGWSSPRGRKLGIKHCHNRPCSLYAVRAPVPAIKDDKHDDVQAINLTPSVCSAFFPRFSPDGKFLVFLSSDSSVKSGIHLATDSLHRIQWPTNGRLSPLETVNVVPVVMCPEDGQFPGLYCQKILSKPWLSDSCTILLSSIWASTLSILAVNTVSGNVVRVSPESSGLSWNILALDGDNIIAECSSPVSVPEIMYGCFHFTKHIQSSSWSWLHLPNPIFRSSDKVASLLSSLQFSIMKIPIRKGPEELKEGTKKPFEAIYVSSKRKDGEGVGPTIVVLHGGPHSASLTTFSKSLAFLSSLGFSLLIVNYRGSLGFGEEALQSLPGKIGTQDVEDVITAVDHIVDSGLADPSKIALLGGSHGGFLTTHLIGQAPDKFAVAAVRNPVCNLALMVGITDIPDWCYVEACGTEDNNFHWLEGTVSAELLPFFHSKSPISHISKVKTPTLFLLGAMDLRVPVSNGLQYARALREKGVAVKVMVFPNDCHGLDWVQTEFESFLNIGVWFTKYCSS